MKHRDVKLLIGEMQESIAALRRLEEVYHAYAGDFADEHKRDLRDAITLSEILGNSYTCLETVFLRVARLFENHLDATQWHRELLHKMRIEVPGIRRALLSRESYSLLDELRRFRHFRRYYYALDYDWAKLDYLRSVYERLCPIIHQQLQDYLQFLEKLTEEDKQ